MDVPFPAWPFRIRRVGTALSCPRERTIERAELAKVTDARAWTQIAVSTLPATVRVWLGRDEAHTEPVSAVSAFGAMPCGYFTLLDDVMRKSSADSGGSGVVVPSVS